MGLINHPGDTTMRYLVFLVCMLFSYNAFGSESPSGKIFESVLLPNESARTVDIRLAQPYSNTKAEVTTKVQADNPDQEVLCELIKDGKVMARQTRKECSFKFRMKKGSTYAVQLTATLDPKLDENFILVRVSGISDNTLIREDIDTLATGYATTYSFNMLRDNAYWFAVHVNEGRAELRCEVFVNGRKVVESKSSKHNIGDLSFTAGKGDEVKLKIYNEVSPTSDPDTVEYRMLFYAEPW
jgi:hypothetical protein